MQQGQMPPPFPFLELLLPSPASPIPSGPRGPPPPLDHSEGQSPLDIQINGPPPSGIRPWPEGPPSPGSEFVTYGQPQFPSSPPPPSPPPLESTDAPRARTIPQQMDLPPPAPVPADSPPRPAQATYSPDAPPTNSSSPPPRPPYALPPPPPLSQYWTMYFSVPPPQVRYPTWPWTSTWPSPPHPPPPPLNPPPLPAEPASSPPPPAPPVRLFISPPPPPPEVDEVPHPALAPPPWLPNPGVNPSPPPPRSPGANLAEPMTGEQAMYATSAYVSHEACSTSC
jgi:hypothetical protein